MGVYAGVGSATGANIGSLRMRESPMNLKKMLVEKERLAYIAGDPKLAKFFDDTLQYIQELEAGIGMKRRHEAELYKELNDANNSRT